VHKGRGESGVAQKARAGGADQQWVGMAGPQAMRLLRAFKPELVARALEVREGIVELEVREKSVAQAVRSQRFASTASTE
jgi:hypothetical protein